MKYKQHMPPKMFHNFFRWYCHPKLVDHIEGDLLEEYGKRLTNQGRRKADFIFAIDVLLLFRRGIIRPYEGYKNVNTYDMYKNYFKIALRNLLKNKGYSFINISGLAVGMAVALLIGLWVQYHLSYDDFHVNKKNIARVMKKTFFNNIKGTQSGVMLPLCDELKANYPEVKRATRLDWGGGHSLMVGEKKIMKEGHFADPDFLKMFTFPLVKGNPDDALKEPYSIVLTESLAAILFGTENPMGKTIILDNAHNVVVTAIAKDVPSNSSITFDLLLPYELSVLTNDFVRGAKDEWQNNFLQNFVELNEGVSPESFSKRIENIEREKANDKDASTLFVHPMEKWHLYGEFKDWVNTGGAIDLIRLFAIIGLLVLSIACINFMNLSTARSEKRAKEVGIRKAIGSQRKQLIMQFLGESMITAFIAFILAIVIAQVSLPFLKSTGFNDISLNLVDFSLLGIVLGGCILTGLFAGCYPALYLSAINAVKVLKGSFQAGKSGNLPRKLLVVTQFSFSIALIIGTIIVFQQVQHAKNRPLGYNPDNLILFHLSSDLEKNYDILKNDLLATGYIEAVSKSSSPMTGVYNQWDDFSWEGKDPDSRPAFSAIMVGHDYDKTSGLKMKEGRFFSVEFATDSNAIVLNAASAALMGFDKPVGSTVKMGEENLTVIGVCEDIVMEDPYHAVGPGLYLLKPYFISQGFIRLKKQADIREAMAAIGPIVEKHNPAYPFEYYFTDDEFDKKFRNENQIGQLSGIFAGLSIFISCLGLFGLASFMAERRTKEIGIRKVVGASVFNLWKMLSKEFVVLIIISCVIATPIAYYFLAGWLERYEYRIEISWWIFVIAFSGALGITLLTVSFQTIKAALMSPVKSLRSE